MNTSALDKIHARYNPEHDLGPDAPVHWSVEELAHLVGKLVKKVEELEELQLRELHLRVESVENIQDIQLSKTRF